MTALIPSYFQIQETAQNYLKDSQLTNDLIDEFIGVAEFEIQRDLLSEEYGTGVPRGMLARVTGQSAADSTYPLPDDYHAARSFTVNGLPARYAVPEQIASSASGYAEAEVVLDYYQVIPQLTQTNPFNWLVQASFDTYLWGVCNQYSLWAHNFADLPTWRLKYEAAIRSLKRTYGAPPRGANVSRQARPYGASYTVIGPNILIGRLS